MFTLKRTPQFDHWLTHIKDPMTARRLQVRLRKVAMGNLGDYAAVGSGVFELREHFGAGWRMYYTMHQGVCIILLGGGNKSSQDKDIQKAIALAQLLDFGE